MSNCRFQFSYRKSSSKYHKKVGEILRDKNGYFSGFKCFQEYPVKKLAPSYSNGKHKFDWVILDLKLVIEVHGQQHFNVVDFGGLGSEKAENEFRMLKQRDEDKKEAALSAGFTYVSIPYWDFEKISSEYIWNLYQENFNDQKARIKPEKIDELRFKYKNEMKEKAREYRKKRYQQIKTWLSENKGAKKNVV